MTTKYNDSFILFCFVFPFAMQGIEPKALGILGKYYTTEIDAQPTHRRIIDYLWSQTDIG